MLLSVHGEHPLESLLPHWRTFDWFDEGIEREEKGFVFIDEGTSRGKFPDFYRTHLPRAVVRLPALESIDPEALRRPRPRRLVMV